MTHKFLTTISILILVTIVCLIVTSCKPQPSCPTYNQIQFNN